MPEYLLQREQFIPTRIDQVFSFFADAANLEFLTPPWLHFRIKSKLPVTMKTGALIDYTIRWQTGILDWSPPHRFIDTQLKGPYKLWHHTHTFAVHSGGTLMTDVVRYALPLGPLGVVAHSLMVHRDLHAIFDYRQKRVAERFGAVKWPVTLSS
jgi:ligand-binding SRPBCC domain-containing protein